MSRKKMKYNLSNFMQNKKLVMAFSIIASIVLWAGISFNSADEERTINNVPVSISFGSGDTANAENLVIYGGKETTANITVQGRKLSINKLTRESFLLDLDFSKITGPGEYSVDLRFAAGQNYNIAKVEPSSVKITCDYFITKNIPIEADTTAINVPEKSKEELTKGTGVINGLSEKNEISVKGPQTIIETIEKLVAVVGLEEPREIEETTNFPSKDVEIRAYDEDNNQVDLEYCEFEDVDEKNISITVPIESFQVVEFEIEYLNLPAYYAEGYLTLDPPHISLMGSKTQVDKALDLVKDLGELDIRRFTPQNHIIKIPINIPQGVSIAGGEKEVSVKFNTEMLSTRTMKLNLTDENTSFLNVPPGAKVERAQNIISDIVLIGPRTTLNNITEDDLRVEIDIKKDSLTGSRNVVANVKVLDYNNVWVHVGKEEEDQYKVVVNISEE